MIKVKDSNFGDGFDIGDEIICKHSLPINAKGKWWIREGKKYKILGHSVTSTENSVFIVDDGGQLSSHSIEYFISLPESRELEIDKILND